MGVRRVIRTCKLRKCVRVGEVSGILAVDTHKYSQEKMDPASLENKLQERISASQHDMLGQLETMLSRKLDSFRTEIQDSQRQLSADQISKLVELNTHSYSFRHKGNEEQFKVNTKVVAKLQEAHSSIVEQQDLVTAADKITEGMNILKYRQKLIRLADSSETGWKIVAEYEANELAEDSDDEKQRAEIRAQRKVKAQRQSRQRRFSPYGAPRPQGPGDLSHMDATKPTIPAHNRRSGLCYSCGKPGHWRIGCQQQQRSVGQGPDKYSCFS
ncbi:uncharacterized protein LOC132556974 [Ylistrum balloti]|uniref:uncharacterized protein LOC132556974 n=1 Tax=Ylistrum balloti TaxID=509963 RepID=UPI0029059FAA|nr:uncharacterized protein LOC132556974 [Ylistrum balloti]